MQCFLLVKEMINCCVFKFDYQAPNHVLYLGGSLIATVLEAKKNIWQHVHLQEMTSYVSGHVLNFF